MGQAVDFELRNDFIGKPESMTDKQCYALPVCRIATFIPGPSEKDMPLCSAAHVSCWELSEEERAEVARTGKVWVKILGVTLYPMSVHGTIPIYLNEGKMSDYVYTKDELNAAKN